MNEIGKLARACRPRHNFQARQALALMVLLALVPSAVFLHGLRAQADAAPQVSPELEALMVTTQEKGSVRVIVGLDVGFRPEGDLAGIQDVLKQRQLIKTTQDAVLRRINLDLALAQLDEGLSIAKTVTLARNPAWRGDPITYTIEVANNSGVTATSVRITDTLPVYVNGADLDTTMTVPAGDSVTYEINATVANDAPYGDTITNTAYYDYAAVSESGKSSVAFDVEDAAVHLAIDKTVTLANNTARGGDPITYTVVVANQGSLTASGVHITDTLPMYVIGTDLDTTATVTAGESVTYTLSATVTDGVPLGATITNTAYYDHVSGSGSSSAVFSLLKYVFLPIVVK